MIGVKSEALLSFRKFLTSKILIKRSRNLSTEKVITDDELVTVEDAIAIPRKKRVRKNKTSSDNVTKMLEYFDSSIFANRIDKMPFTMFRQRMSRPEHLYLFDDKIADKFVDLIRDDLLQDPSKVVEVNAGAGILTEKLLAAGVRDLTIMETQSKCVQFLANLQKDHPDRLKVIGADLFDMWRIAYQDKRDGGNRVATLFSDYPHLPWGKELGLKVIGAVPNINFVRHLILDIVKQCGLVSCGRPCLYLCVPPSVWKRLTSDHTASLKEYRAIAVLFQLFFDYRLLGEFPRKAFLPWVPGYSQKKKTKGPTKSQVDREHMCVARIEAKEDLLTDVINEKLLQPLWYFVSHHMVARRGRVIPQME